MRQIFVARFGAAKRTILHGNSWGASVAAKTAELFGDGASNAGKPPYDGVLLTSGVLGGASKSYDSWLDLRVVYEVVCGNHPLPSEPQYPLWQGLPIDNKMTRPQLAAAMQMSQPGRVPLIGFHPLPSLYRHQRRGDDHTGDA